MMQEWLIYLFNKWPWLNMVMLNVVFFSKNIMPWLIWEKKLFINIYFIAVIFANGSSVTLFNFFFFAVCSNKARWLLKGSIECLFFFHEVFWMLT